VSKENLLGILKKKLGGLISYGIISCNLQNGLQKQKMAEHKRKFYINPIAVGIQPTLLVQ
jgi:hypothetical protein